MVPEFLVLFDAIFTLNQDLLLESHYLTPPGGLSLVPGTRWDIEVLPVSIRLPTPMWSAVTMFFGLTGVQSHRLIAP